MKHLRIFSLVLVLTTGLLFSLSCNSCQSSKKTVMTETYNMVSPEFNADSAYYFIERQVAFGPRVPGTQAHELCGDYLKDKLEGFGADVVEQHADVTHYDGRNISLRNIIGSYNLEADKRILLFAHWDSRPFSDEEIDPDKHNQAILGADDGASGVGVLLEVARQLQQNPLDIGIDIIFFDLEDWGQPSFSSDWVKGEWWCIGSSYWSEQPHIEAYKASFGILLDMVGGVNATFLREGYSVQYASNVVDKIWSTAAKLGYTNYFLPQRGGYITDDHLPVNQHHRAPSANIINLKQDTRTGFAPYWHTQSDDMRNIDKKTLKAVGQTVMEVIYTENK
ncbi:MAG TPA: glutamine cyclotransferase [Porphyromonadaceae bacterium]|jgi:glutaminyl-peptide cyclotransferase|nr:M28 family peptidase [Bacteroidales bacterium]HBT85494.1 glutamine cyclotransferase [Porphyromonadaceae bacterium]